MEYSSYSKYLKHVIKADTLKKEKEEKEKEIAVLNEDLQEEIKILCNLLPNNHAISFTFKLNKNIIRVVRFDENIAIGKNRNALIYINTDSRYKLHDFYGKEELKKDFFMGIE